MDIWAPDKASGAPTWTPAPNPWRVFRRVAAWATVSGLLAWGAWAGLQHLPTITFRMPTIAHVEPVINKSVNAIEERLAPEKPAVAKAPTKTGPVIQTITTD